MKLKVKDWEWVREGWCEGWWEKKDRIIYFYRKRESNDDYVKPHKIIPKWK